MRKYFGTDGIRGIANEKITPELAYKAAKAGACVFSKGAEHTPLILIGKDTRISGDLIESSMTAGFLSMGVNVMHLGVVPTPAVAFLTRRLNADASVMISASHNSYEYNGIKFFSNKGMKIADSIEEEIESFMDNDKIAELKNVNDKIGKCINNENLIEEYLQFFVENFEKEIKENIDKNIVIGVDAANGATYEISEKIFNALGINYKIIENNPNGININSDCGSTHMGRISRYVVENKLSFGFAYDGDGDRCLAVDENGEVIDGDIILAIFAKYLKNNKSLNKNTIVATVMSNLGLNKFSEKNELNLKQTKVGDRYVLEKMLKEGYNLGGEQSGHVILLDYNPTGDGILTSILLTLIMLKSKCSLSKLREDIKIYPQVLINAKVNNDKKNKFNEDKEISAKIKEVEEEFENNGRVLVRASGTENLIRVMIEGENKEYITKKAHELVDLIEKNLG